MSTFNNQPTLRGGGITLRPLKQDDFNGLHAAAANPKIWAGHPATERYKRDVFRPYFDMLLDSGGTLVIIDDANGKIIGCSRYYTAPDMPNSISIGFTFLNNAYWGGDTNFTIKQLMLGHAFQSFPDVWLHIGPTNIRSQKATAKLGAVHVYDACLDLAGGAADWKIYQLTKSAWETARTAKLATESL